MAVGMGNRNQALDRTILIPMSARVKRPDNRLLCPEKRAARCRAGVRREEREAQMGWSRQAIEPRIDYGTDRTSASEKRALIVSTSLHIPLQLASSGSVALMGGETP